MGATAIDQGALAELAQPVSRPNLVLVVPDRSGWSVEFSTLLNADLLKAWTKRATDSRTGEADLFEVALLVVAGQCVGLMRDGKPIELDGQRLTFASPPIAELYGSTDVRVTVREFYGNDAVVGTTYGRLLEAAQSGDLTPVDA